MTAAVQICTQPTIRNNLQKLLKPVLPKSSSVDRITQTSDAVSDATMKRNPGDDEMTKTRTAAEIQAEINNLLKLEVCVGHNEGTFSAEDAHRKVGTGDPSFATRNEYETVGGEKRSTGPSVEKIPGYMQYGGRERLAQHRRELADLYAELKTAKK